MSAATRELVRRLDSLSSRERTLAVETTLASRGYVSKLRRWSGLGDSTSLHFTGLPSADFAQRGVAIRVAAGGRDAPEADIRRRLERGLRLFPTVYQPLVDRW